MKLKIRYDLILLLIFFLILNWMGYANYSDYKIVHDYPFGYRSSDMFERSFLAESIKDTGNFKYLAPYLSQGLPDMVSHYYPSFEHLPAALSSLTGFEVYDCTYFIAFFLTNLSALLMYLLIAKYNKKVAILALPFMLLVYTGKFSVGSIVGIWGYSASVFLLVSFALILSYFENRGVYILGALVLVAITHFRTSDLVVAGIIFAAYFTLKTFTGKLTKDLTKKALLMILIATVLSSYYILYFKGISGLLTSQIPLADFKKPVDEFYASHPTDFGIYLLVALVIGVFSSILFYRKWSFLILIGLIMLGLNYIDILGGKFATMFNSRTFMLPIYVSFFFAVVVYLVLSSLDKYTNIRIRDKAAIFALVIAAIIIFTQMNHLDFKEGLFNKEKWDGFKWIQTNTQTESNVLFLYGDNYNQVNMLLFLKRNPFYIDINQVQKEVQSGKIERMHKIRPLYSVFYFKKGVLQFGDLLVNNSEYDKSGKNFQRFEKYVLREYKDICSFDYYIIDKYSAYPIVIERFNNKFKTTALKKGWFEAVYENEDMTILKNNNIGGDCLNDTVN